MPPSDGALYPWPVVPIESWQRARLIERDKSPTPIGYWFPCVYWSLGDPATTLQRGYYGAPVESCKARNRGEV